MEKQRAPVAARVRRPGWRDPRLLAGVVLIAVAVVGVIALLRDADRTIPMYAARTTLAPGAVIGEADLAVAHVRVGGGYLEAPGQSPVGRVVDRVVAAGELVPSSAVVDVDDFGDRPVAVAATVALSDGIETGATVDVWVTREDDARARSTLVAAGATVAQVERDDGAFGGAAATVHVLVPAGEVGGLLDALVGAEAVAVVGVG